jgi:hypothetical protein
MDFLAGGEYFGSGFALTSRWEILAQPFVDGKCRTNLPGTSAE